MRRSKVIIGILQHVVCCQQRGIARLSGSHPGFARRMLGLHRLEFAFELGNIRGKGSVCVLEDLEAFLCGIYLGSEIDILLLQSGYPVLPVVRKPALFII